MEERAETTLVYPTLYQSEPTPPEKSEIETILEWLENHMVSEKSAIAEYEDLASKAGNDTVRFLMNLIVEEEEKHHHLLEVMIQTLRESLTWRKHPEAIHFHTDLGVDKEELRRATERFLAQERDGIRRCRALKRESKKLYYGLFDIFFDLMIRDSLKHQHLLRYINKTLNLL
jgi:rubrerythrin